MSGAPVRRLFLALWPDDETRAALAKVQAQLREDCGGRAVPPENLHVTLKFLGPVAEDALPRVVEGCLGASVSPATVVLERLGLLPRTGVLWIGATEIPSGLARLAVDLDARLAPLGFSPERRPFRPHCTLFRRARRRPRIEPRPVEWCVDSFRLVESTLSAEGARYRILDTFLAVGA